MAYFVASMSISRTTSSIPPIFFRAAARSARRNPHRLPRTIPAIAILVPRRGYAPEPTTESGSGQHNFPPPGFNSEQAKRPLQQDKQKQLSAEAAQSQSAPSIGSTSTPATSHNEAATADAKSTKEDQTLTEIATEKASTDKEVQKKADKKKEENKKLTIWQKVKKEANHYWDGTKLLGTEVKISFKLAVKMAAGYELTRREHRQVRSLLIQILRT